MIKRISMWKLNNKNNAEKMKTALLSMRGNVPSLLDIEVGLNISQSKSAFDIVFIGLFDSAEKLKEFEADSFHKSVGEIVDGLREKRVVVDYELKHTVCDE